MHRHGYQGRKFKRDRDQRRALLKGLANQLIEHGSITTTLPRAKDLVPYVEVLITKAKVGNLHSRRQIIGSLTTLEAAHKLVDEIAPQLKNRTSGHLRIKKAGARVGDSADMAQISFVDELKAVEPAVAEPKAEKAPAVARKKKEA